MLKCITNNSQVSTIDLHEYNNLFHDLETDCLKLVGEFSKLDVLNASGLNLQTTRFENKPMN